MPGPKYTKKQKDLFFDLIDRGGTVKAAAMDAGDSRLTHEPFNALSLNTGFPRPRRSSACTRGDP